MSYAKIGDCHRDNVVISTLRWLTCYSLKQGASNDSTTQKQGK